MNKYYFGIMLLILISLCSCKSREQAYFPYQSQEDSFSVEFPHSVQKPEFKKRSARVQGADVEVHLHSAEDKENGVAYVAGVAMSSSYDEARCSNEDYIRKIAESCLFKHGRIKSLHESEYNGHPEWLITGTRVQQGRYWYFSFRYICVDHKIYNIVAGTLDEKQLQDPSVMHFMKSFKLDD